MTQYDNTNRGVLFDNERKESDKHPDLNGSINVNGQEFWLSGWWKTAQSGREFLSLSVKPKEAQEGQQAQQPRRGNRPAQQAPQRTHSEMKRGAPATATGFDDMDDDIPF